MNDLKKFFKTIKELWSNPKLKGTVQLVFWILFFIIVALLFRTSSNNRNVDKVDDNKNNNVEKKEKTNDETAVLSYDFMCDYTDNTGSTHITGTNFKNKNVFYQENSKYYFVNNKYYNALDNSIIEYPYNLIEWLYSNVKNMMDSNKYTNVTKYKDGLIKYEYIIDHNIYNNYYSKNYENDIIMNITMDNNIIKEVTINYGFSSVLINYSKINEIEDVEINID